MIKRFAIGIAVLLGNATVSFANEVVQTKTVQQIQKVNVGTYTNILVSTGDKLDDVILKIARPKPSEPKPKPRGPGG